MRTYNSLLAELRTEGGFQVATHFNRFKAVLKNTNLHREVYILASDACKKAITNTAKNLLQKSKISGVDDYDKLIDGIASISLEYEQQFMSKVREYLHQLEMPGLVYRNKKAPSINEGAGVSDRLG